MTSIVYGGRTNQGQPLGVLMLDTKFPRIPGDVGNAFTFDFPVRYYTVKDASINRAVKMGDPSLLPPFIEGAKALEAAGCGAIATSCGFLVMFQQQLAAAVDIPVISSSLLQVPYVARMLGPDHKVGILTARAASLGEKHFRGAGMADLDVAIKGMDEYPEFTRAFILDEPCMDVDLVEKEMEAAARSLVETEPNLGAVVLECTNMPPFAHIVRRVTARPVYDVYTLISHTVGALLRRPFPRTYL